MNSEKWSNTSALILMAGLLLVNAPASAQEALSLEKAAQKSNNPVSDAWLLITQNDYTTLEGDATGGGSEMQERLSFQPVMPIPIRGGDSKCCQIRHLSNTRTS